jgi:hypothetical protein
VAIEKELGRRFCSEDELVWWQFNVLCDLLRGQNCPKKYWTKILTAYVAQERIGGHKYLNDTANHQSNSPAYHRVDHLLVAIIKRGHVLSYYIHDKHNRYLYYYCNQI